ncbi:MAG: hypothetical protein JWQ11_3707 [Rhizobacter sp.]|nr:hypothetical protein [Rhizobacter sp.]
MSLKKTDLEKNKAKKIASQIRMPGAADRFGQGSGGEAIDRREQRRLDAAAGLVPFACKLPSELVKQLQERAATQEGGLNALIAEFVTQGLAAKS